LESLFATLKAYGIGRISAILGAMAGVAAVFALIFLNTAGAPQSLLYSNLDLKEATEISSALEQAGIKHEMKGDGSTVFVKRDEVATARMMLASKGLPTQASVGYEIFDNAPALGQTEFVQKIDRQRALEGELSRTIRSLRGISSARVHLVIPERDLFSDTVAAPSGSVVVGLSGGALTPDQIAAIRNLVASAVPNLKADSITLVDDRNRLLAAGGDGQDGLDPTGAGRKSEIEDILRKRVLDIVQGVVGPGAARVMVTADINPTARTKEEVRYDPDGQVVRSTQTGEQTDRNSDGTNGGVTAANNIPGGAGAGAGSNVNESGETNETTNYEISSTKTTEITAPGELRKVSVSVAVDHIATPAKDAKSQPTYAARSAEDMKRIEDLVRAAVGYDAQRGDQMSVVNIRFNAPALGAGTTAAPPLLDFTKNDIMRGIEILILLILGLLTIFLVARPLLKYIKGDVVVEGGKLIGPGGVILGPAGVNGVIQTADGPVVAMLNEKGEEVYVPATEMDQRIDMARIEGQVKASSVKKVSEFVDRHPEESLAILRSWLHES